MPVARKILDESEALLNPQDRERVLDGLLYKYNYQKTTQVFRNGAMELLQALVDEQCYIVTNSHTDAVQHKLSLLENKRKQGKSLSPFQSRVFGRAQKYVVDPTFDLVPESLTLPELSRPVLLRRRHYYQVLNELLSSCNLDWSQLWIFGDIFELDLSLPLSLGAQVGLVVNPFTPSWELNFLQSHPRGHLINDLSEVLSLTQNNA